MQRSCPLAPHNVAVRDRIGGNTAETFLTEQEPELHAHKKVAHGCSGAGVSRNTQISESGDFYDGLELGKGADGL
jgi:hypothetical protein